MLLPARCPLCASARIARAIDVCRARRAAAALRYDVDDARIDADARVALLDALYASA